MDRHEVDEHVRNEEWSTSSPSQEYKIDDGLSEGANRASHQLDCKASISSAMSTATKRTPRVGANRHDAVKHGEK